MLKNQNSNIVDTSMDNISGIYEKVHCCEPAQTPNNGLVRLVAPALWSGKTSRHVLVLVLFNAFTPSLMYFGLFLHWLLVLVLRTCVYVYPASNSCMHHLCGVSDELLVRRVCSSA